LVEERGFLVSLQNLERVEAEMPLEEMLTWMASGAVNLMDENREFLRVIIMEGLGGDEAALEQYGRLIDLWEQALTAVLKRYENKGELPSGSPDTLARQVIYLVHMAFVESLLGRQAGAELTVERRREVLATFAAQAIHRLVGCGPGSA
jgi:hypothetical protein